jgi:hypothetical protein
MAFPSTKHDDVDAWRVAVFVVFLPVVAGSILWVASLLSDSGRVPAELAASAQESGVMQCAEGTIVHGSGSLLDRVVASARFQCTYWRLRAKLVDSATGTVNWPTSPKR